MYVYVHEFSLQPIPYCSYTQKPVEEPAEQEKASSCLFLPIAATLVSGVLVLVLVLVSKLKRLQMRNWIFPHACETPGVPNAIPG